MSDTIYDIEVQTATGETTTLADFADKLVLVVDVASRCGLAPLAGTRSTTN